MFRFFDPGLIYGKGLEPGKQRSQPGGDQCPTRGSHHDGDRPVYPNPRDTLEAGIGNKSIALKNCHNVLLRDFSILHGGHFAILATGVDNFTLDNLKIDTNRDGMDIDCCRNVRVSNCSVNSPWDDAICPKSSYALGYLRPTRTSPS